MESVCREALMRHSSDKLEDLSSQDDCESDMKRDRSESPVAANVTAAQPAEPPTETKPPKAASAAPSPPVQAPECAAEKVSKDLESSVPEKNGGEIVKEAAAEKPSEAVGQQDAKEKEKTEDAVVESSESGIEVSAENKDCDKPKRGSEKDEERELQKVDKVPTAEPLEVMDLDSEGSEASTVAVPSEKDAKVVVASQEVKREEEVLPHTEQENADETAGVTDGEPAADALKRKRSPSPESAEKTRAEEQKKRKQDEPTVNSTSTPVTVLEPQPSAAKLPSRLTETASEELRRELEENFGRHDKLLREYITRSSAESAGGVQKQVDQLVLEIDSLNEMIRAKEVEWNNLVHLRKVKEELVLRLTRKRHVDEIEAAPLEKMGAIVAQALTGNAASPLAIDASSFAPSKAAVQANKLIQNMQMSNSTLSGAASKTTQSILHNRASMTSEDLEKEKKNTAKLHR